MKNRLKIPGMQWHTVAFAVCLVVSTGLIVAGFIVPPTGVIDPSVLTAVGELFAFAALSQLPYVIASGKGITLNHGNTSISVGRKPHGRPEDTEYDDKEGEDIDPC